MTGNILQELNLDELARQIGSSKSPIVFLAAPNFEDRSVASAAWFLDKLGERSEGIGVHVLWLQTPGIDDIFDQIKADNRDTLIGQFRFLDSRLVTTRLDLPATDARVVIDKTRTLASHVGDAAVLILDISSLPRTVVRHVLDGILSDQRRNIGANSSSLSHFSRIICLYTAAGDYPVGAGADQIGGIEGYFTKRRLHDLVATAGILEAVVSLAGTSHDAAQTLDALWSHGSSAKTSISALVLLNRENFVYSYQKLSVGTWALKKAPSPDFA